MANHVNDSEPRTFLYLGEQKKTLSEYAKTDPRFRNMSECARHIIEKGIAADKADREKVINALHEGQ